MTTVDISGKLVFWDATIFAGGLVEKVRRCGPLVSVNEIGTATVVQGTAFDRGCPPEEKGKRLPLRRGTWSYNE